MIVQYEEQLLELIDQEVATASDDELFAGGYLRGHISLAAADCEANEITDINQFQQKIVQSFHDSKSELTPADQIIVNDIWFGLVSKISV
ncbi:MAG: YfcL family protein [Aliivibrio sp.]|uniref:YfcL family protein n=1 Tax=Aliivibrio sp. TaxID=1872443 RepID=UPI001A5D25BD|nr:YfcL family protein [Aliivibrio sp.]